MSNDNLQVLAFYLEMLGIGLAVLHVFVPEFSARLNRRIHVVLVALGTKGMDYALPGVDYDDDIPDEDKNATALSHMLFAFFSIACIIWLAGRINFGEGLGWGVLEYLAASIPGMLLAVVAHILFSFLMSVFDAGLKAMGNREYAASIGFVLASAGLLIEAKQILDSPLAYSLLLFPFALVMFYLAKFIRFLHHL